MAKIVRFHQFGSADVLELEDVTMPEPADGEVRIRVEALGLNRAEVVFRQGKYLESPILPSKIGYEAAGTIDAVGSGVTGFKEGDRVSTVPAFSMTKYGVYGEVAIVPARAVAHYPSNLTPQEAASIWMQYLTAYGALVEFGKLAVGDHVLITAGSSSVGHAAIQICNALGAIPIATTRGAAKKDQLTAGGAKHVIVSDEENIPRRVEEITGGKGARLIFDPVAGQLLNDLAKAAAFQGIIFVYGALSMTQTPFPLMLALQKGLSIRGYTLFEITNDEEAFSRSKQFVYDGLQSGSLKPVIDPQTFSLADIAEAHRYMESNVQNGKIVVTV
jgi:NADPH:quinone reductase-like Zn-dependent oxidoreductase